MSGRFCAAAGEMAASEARHGIDGGDRGRAPSRDAPLPRGRIAVGCAGRAIARKSRSRSACTVRDPRSTLWRMLGRSHATWPAAIGLGNSSRPNYKPHAVDAPTASPRRHGAARWPRADTRSRRVGRNHGGLRACGSGAWHEDCSDRYGAIDCEPRAVLHACCAAVRAQRRAAPSSSWMSCRPRRRARPQGAQGHPHGGGPARHAGAARRAARR